jgi:hypothetical protein
MAIPTDAALNSGRCGDCGYERLGPMADDDLTRCLECGSANQSIRASISDHALARDSMRMKIRDDRFVGRHKLRTEIFSGADRRVSKGDFIHRETVVDHANNRYTKTLREESGELIIHVDKPLNEHTGHGSAKFKKPKPDDGSNIQ